MRYDEAWWRCFFGLRDAGFSYEQAKGIIKPMDEFEDAKNKFPQGGKHCNEEMPLDGSFPSKILIEAELTSFKDLPSPECCPFCKGRESSASPINAGSSSSVFLLCRTCGATGPKAGTVYHAIILWNAR